MRFRYGSVPPGTGGDWFQRDATLGWTLKPGHYPYFHVGASRRVDVSINGLGLRNPPLTLEPPPGKVRVSVVGDSFVFAAALTDDESLTQQLQETAGDGYEIVNISVQRYGTGQQIRLLDRLKEKGFLLGEKLILVFYTNDILDNEGLDYGTLKKSSGIPAFWVDENGILKQTNPVAPNGPDIRKERSLLQRSLFYNFLRYRAEILVVSHQFLADAMDAVGLIPTIPRTPGVINAWYGAGWEERWDNTDRILHHLADSLREERGDPELYIAFVPSPFQVHEVFQRMVYTAKGQDPRYEEFLADIDRPQRMLRRFCESQGIPFIDTTEALRETRIAYFPRDGHLNSVGAKVVARLLYQQVLDKPYPEIERDRAVAW